MINHKKHLLYTSPIDVINNSSRETYVILTTHELMTVINQLAYRDILKLNNKILGVFIKIFHESGYQYNCFLGRDFNRDDIKNFKELSENVSAIEFEKIAIYLSYVHNKSGTFFDFLIKSQLNILNTSSEYIIPQIKKLKNIMTIDQQQKIMKIEHGDNVENVLNTAKLLGQDPFDMDPCISINDLDIEINQS